LEEVLDVPCALLSAGQQRQAGLLRLWASQARLWLLDEPLVALDERAMSVLLAKMAEHRTTGGAILMTSHQDLPLNPANYQEYQL
jgi:heme exporter protein A